MIEEIRKKIVKCLDLDSGDMRSQLKNSQNESFIDFMIEFFNSKDVQDKVKKKKHMNIDREHNKFLLCLDGAEDLINHNQSEFNEFLHRLLNECATLSIIITTSCSVNMLVSEHGFAPRIILLKPLKQEESVEQFLSIANDVTA